MDSFRRGVESVSAARRAAKAFEASGRDYEAARTGGLQGAPKKDKPKGKPIPPKRPQKQPAGSIPPAQGYSDNQPQYPGTSQPEPHDGQYRPAGPYQPDRSYSSPNTGDQRPGEAARYYEDHPQRSQTQSGYPSNNQGGYSQQGSYPTTPIQQPQRGQYSSSPPDFQQVQGPYSQPGYHSSPPPQQQQQQQSVHDGPYSPPPPQQQQHHHQQQQQRSMHNSYPQEVHRSDPRYQSPPPRQQPMQDHYSSPRTFSSPTSDHRPSPHSQTSSYHNQQHQQQQPHNAQYFEEPATYHQPSNNFPYDGYCNDCNKWHVLSP